MAESGSFKPMEFNNIKCAKIKGQRGELSDDSDGWFLG